MDWGRPTHRNVMECHQQRTGIGMGWALMLTAGTAWGGEPGAVLGVIEAGSEWYVAMVSGAVVVGVGRAESFMGGWGTGGTQVGLFRTDPNSNRTIHKIARPLARIIPCPFCSLTAQFIIMCGKEIPLFRPLLLHVSNFPQ